VLLDADTRVRKERLKNGSWTVPKRTILTITGRDISEAHSDGMIPKRGAPTSTDALLFQIGRSRPDSYPEIVSSSRGCHRRSSSPAMARQREATYSSVSR
jgi:hypothetical protein